MELWFKSLNEVSEKYNDLEFILPIHPNPNVYKHKKILNKNIKVVDPLSHEELINVLLECRFVISDSGGIQEEATFLNKKTIFILKN